MVESLFTSLLLPIALAILVSGLDDIVVDVAWLSSWISSRWPSWRGRAPGDAAQAVGAFPDESALASVAEKRIAVMIPLWHEHSVIRGMLEHNLAACNYRNLHFFAGGYPNDERTLDVVAELDARHSTVHLCVCPHDGPTSKADCLNWIYQRILVWEGQHGERFELVMVHDAEDLIHPESLRFVNYYAEKFDMVQVPVLALQTPFREPVHGLYCDEFAEYQTRDMGVRGWMGAFLPSTGVGTAIRREALELLADVDENRLFAPESLTEDYEIGLRLKALGCSQICLPVEWFRGSLVATREYFPRDWSAALRQRTRWVTGICLQTWQRHGWPGRPVDLYWLWRDRKGLVGNPLGLLANLLTLYGLCHWNLVLAMPSATKWLMAATLFAGVIRLGVRFGCVRRIYGTAFAFGVPFRALLGNALNSAACTNALVRFAWARFRGNPLQWSKTEHAYPSRGALARHKRRIGEVLTGGGFVSQVTIDHALARRADGLRLGEFLLARGGISERQLYSALCVQHGLLPGPEEVAEIRIDSLRLVPAHIADAWRMLPFDVDAGRLRIAVDDVPSEELIAVVRRYTRLDPEFHLVAPAKLSALRMLLAV